MLIPFALGWAGGYLTWKAFVPTVCGKTKGGLYGLPKRKNRAARRAR
jgi:hypothetical protein